MDDKTTLQTYENLRKLSNKFPAGGLGKLKKLEYVSPQTLRGLMTLIWDDVNSIDGEIFAISTDLSMTLDSLSWANKGFRKYSYKYGYPEIFLEEIERLGLKSNDQKEITEFIEIGLKLCTYFRMFRFWLSESCPKKIKNSLDSTVIELLHDVSRCLGENCP